MTRVLWNVKPTLRFSSSHLCDCHALFARFFVVVSRSFVFTSVKAGAFGAAFIALAPALFFDAKLGSELVAIFCPAYVTNCFAAWGEASVNNLLCEDLNSPRIWISAIRQTMPIFPNTIYVNKLGIGTAGVECE